MSKSPADPEVIHVLQHAISRAIDTAPVAFRARLIASTEVGADAAAWRLALRILPELDAAGWRFDAGWRHGRRKEVVGDLDDVIATGFVSAGAGALADAVCGMRNAVEKLAHGAADELARCGIRPRPRAIAAE